MRVIAGEFKGRKLSAPSGLDVRPTSGRLRQTLFSILADLVRGATFWDSFAGSGAVGIEALSRGAARVHFSEKDARTRRCLEQNLKRIGVSPDRYRIHSRGATETLTELKRDGLLVDFVFIDPPYHGSAASRFLQGLAGAGVLSYRAQVIVEFFCKTPPALPSEWTPARVVRHGQTCLGFLVAS